MDLKSLPWRKSSFSSETANCVEFAVTDQNALPWRKSSFSSDTMNCVEFAPVDGRVVGVRDSKDPDGPALWFDTDAWQAFVDAVKHDEV